MSNQEGPSAPKEQPLNQGESLYYEPFMRWLQANDLLTAEDKAISTEKVDLTEYRIKENNERFETDIANKVIELPDDKSADLKRQIKTVLEILDDNHKTIMRNWRGIMPDMRALRQLRDALRQKLTANGFTE